MSDEQTIRRRFCVTGQVQGVGFRPFVHRLATALRLAGFVRNDSRGVAIEVQGPAERVAEFVERLRAELPFPASISRLDASDVELRADDVEFAIVPSVDGDSAVAESAAAGLVGAAAQVAVDSAVCDECLAELRDPGGRRFRYAFLNCAHCGPRYSIVRRIPYDRPNTTMDGFAMCPDCRREYDDPADRRFHAQPIACPACGPRVWLVDSRGQAVVCEDAVARAAELLLEGRVLAIKGLGGFHLCCRADRDEAVRALRRRKRRDAKPLAVMLADLNEARRYVEVSVEAAKQLTAPARPIVLLPTRKPPKPRPARGSEPAVMPQTVVIVAVAPSVTGGMDTLGVMLPYTPLHHLLFDAGLRHVPLVMTSGNLSDQPLVTDNDDALTQLGSIADFLLLHDRPIERSLDDSVVQLHPDGPSLLRRARGYAPQPLELRGTGVPPACPVDVSPTTGGARATIFALGADLKNTLCLLRADKAMLSEHLGDLNDGRVYRHYMDTIARLIALYEAQPTLLAADLHPSYVSTQAAMRWQRGEFVGQPAVPVVRVQHHHAHIAACLAEHGVRGPVIGLACDGAGFGDDRATWGCEVLLADRASYKRLGHLRYTPLPGGDAAAREPARPALAALWDAFGTEIHDLPVARQLAGGEDSLERFAQMLAVGANCPPAGSLGRWFDAVAALTGLAGENAFEAQAAMKLEQAVVAGVENAYAFKIAPPPTNQFLYLSQVGPLLHRKGDVPFEIDLRPMVAELCNDLSAGFDAGVIAARFHNTVAAFLMASASRAREETGLHTVALSGGCFANRYLTARLSAKLTQARFTVLRHRAIPCNDGNIALGQAVVAASSL